MIVPKWNYFEHKYNDHFIPNGWNCKTYSHDLDEIVNCAQCGRELKMGNSFCSLELHTPITGFGYAICEYCHDTELNIRNKFLRQND